MSTATMAEPSLKECFTRIAEVMRKAPDYAALIVNHIAAKHEIHTVPAFYHTTAFTEAEKLATFKEVIKGVAAHHAGKPHGLLGSVAAGQAASPAPEPVATPEPAAAEQAEGLTTRRDYVLPEAQSSEPTTTDAPAVEIEAEAPPPPPRPKPATMPDDPITARLRELIREIIGPIDAQLDEDAVNKLIAAANSKRSDYAIAEKLKKLIDALKTQLQGAIASGRDALEEQVKALSKSIDERLKNLPAGGGRVLEIKVGPKVNKIEGLTHRQFMQIATWCAADVPVWAWGPAGGGKTTLGEQVAQALGVPFTCISIDETITVGKLVGFKNLATGDYVEGLLYRIYKEGGVALLDEIDTNAPTMASLNAMLANDHYTFGNGERVQRHENFRVIAGANTKGTGAVAGYTARVRLDAATLDRFAVIELEYDWDMVEGIALGKPVKTEPWAPVAPATAATLDRYVSWVKAISKEHGKSVLISPRAALLGVRALRAGIPMEEVAEALVFKLMSADTRTRILNSHPLPSSLAVAA